MSPTCPSRPVGQWVNGAENVEMRVGDTVIPFGRYGNRNIAVHISAHKPLHQKLPRKSDILLEGERALQGNIEAVCELGFFP